MQTIQRTFEGHNIRVFQQDGAAWFVLADVCKVLGLSNARVVSKRLDDDEVSLAYVTDSLNR